MNNFEQEQLAAYIVAIMQANFYKPSIEEMQQILRLAGEELAAIFSGRRGCNQGA